MKEIIRKDNYEDYVFYSIEVASDGTRMVHILEDYYYVDEDTIGVNEYRGLVINLEDFVNNYSGAEWMDKLWSECKKGIDYISKEEFSNELLSINSELSVGNLKFLDFRDITIDTEPGNYVGGYNRNEQCIEFIESRAVEINATAKPFSTPDFINSCTNWIKKVVKDNKAVVEINGDLDSTVVAHLLVKALGKENVVGVIMPCGNSEYLEDAEDVIKSLGINRFEVDLQETYEGLNKAIMKNLDSTVHQQLDNYKTNTPARLRMSALYGISSILGNCRVANTLNFSKAIIGYTTIFGDFSGDLAPITRLNMKSVKRVAKELGIPTRIIEKEPWDGMSYKSPGIKLLDEEKLGVTYDEIDLFLFHEQRGLSIETISEIRRLLEKSSYKLKTVDLNIF